MLEKENWLFKSNKKDKNHGQKEHGKKPKPFWNGDEPWMVYKNAVEIEGHECVALVINETDDTVGTYKSRNQHEQAFRTNGPDFIRKYNGNHRPDAISIGSLATGLYKFQFSFRDCTTGNAVEIPYLPMTFYDLDGSTKVPGKSYEVCSTEDAEGEQYFKETLVKHGCGDNGYTGCYAESAKVEIDIPRQLTHLSRETKKATVTFLFKNKSDFVINYELNFPHRVFLFNGVCAL